MRDNRTINDMGDMTLEHFSLAVNFFTSGDKILINGDPFNYIIFHEFQNDYCLVNNASSDDKYSISIDDLFDLVTDKRSKEKESDKVNERVLCAEADVEEANTRIGVLEELMIATKELLVSNKSVDDTKISKLEKRLEKVDSLYYYSLPAIILINIIILVL